MACGGQANGDTEWWRMREAVLLAVGAVAEPLLEVQAQQDKPAQLDIPALLHNVLQEDLINPHTPPFLTGRALWMAARWHSRCAFLVACGVYLSLAHVTAKRSVRRSLL